MDKETNQRFNAYFENKLNKEVDKAEIRSLEWLLKNAWGGGNWRRIATQRISQLQEQFDISKKL